MLNKYLLIEHMAMKWLPGPGEIFPGISGNTAFTLGPLHLVPLTFSLSSSTPNIILSPVLPLRVIPSLHILALGGWGWIEGVASWSLSRVSFLELVFVALKSSLSPKGN